MSKYIRFINAYNDNKEELLNVSEYWHKDSDGGYSIDGYTIYGREVIKEADTIEELCDEFVMFCPNAGSKKIRVYSTMSSISLYFKRDKRWNGNMIDKAYGAIWTDKGLIYVAKMNDKGEFELI